MSIQEPATELMAQLTNITLKRLSGAVYTAYWKRLMEIYSSCHLPAQRERLLKDALDKFKEPEEEPEQEENLPF